MITPSTVDKDMAAPVAPPAAGFREWFRQAGRRCERHLAHRRSRRALAELDGLLLQDIGLTGEEVSRNRVGEAEPASALWRWAAN